MVLRKILQKRENISKSKLPIVYEYKFLFQFGFEAD